MTWDQARIDAQGNTRTTMAVALRIGRYLTGAGVSAGTLLAASDAAIDSDLLLDAESLTGTGAKITPRDWTYGSGAWSVVLILPARMEQGRVQDIAARLRRGALVEILVSAGASAIEDYLRWGVGVLTGVKSIGPRILEVTVYDLLYALRSRPYATLDGSLPQTELFYGLAGTETTSTTVWTNGSSTTLTLTDSANFETFDGTGVIRIVDDAGATIYLTYTGKTGHQLTGVSTAGQLGTSTTVNAAVGAVVTSSVYLDDHPLIIALQLITSTGTASGNGAFDVYPEQGGFAIDQAWIDLHRFRLVISEVLTPDTGDYTWRFPVDDPVPDGLLWLTGLLAESGIGLCIRQGQISAWSAQTLAAINMPSFDLTDADIDGFPSCDWFDPAAAFSYNRMQVDTAGGSSESVLPITVLPSRDEIVYDLSEIIRNNGAAVRLMLIRNLDDWCHYPPEIVRLTLRGALWGLAVGDVGTLTTDRVRGRLVSTSGGYARRDCMIIEYNADPIAGTTAITLAITPNSPADDYA